MFALPFLFLFSFLQNPLISWSAHRTVYTENLASVFPTTPASVRSAPRADRTRHRATGKTSSWMRQLAHTVYSKDVFVPLTPDSKPSQLCDIVYTPTDSCRWCAGGKQAVIVSSVWNPPVRQNSARSICTNQLIPWLPARFAAFVRPWLDFIQSTCLWVVHLIHCAQHLSFTCSTSRSSELCVGSFFISWRFFFLCRNWRNRHGHLLRSNSVTQCNECISFHLALRIILMNLPSLGNVSQCDVSLPTSSCDKFNWKNTFVLLTFGLFHRNGSCCQSHSINGFLCRFFIKIYPMVNRSRSRKDIISIIHVCGGKVFLLSAAPCPHRFKVISSSPFPFLHSVSILLFTSGKVPLPILSFPFYI